MDGRHIAERGSLEGLFPWFGFGEAREGFKVVQCVARKSDVDLEIPVVVILIV